MILLSNDFKEGGSIPSQLAFCKPDDASHAALSANLNPHLKWSDVPPQTQSFALICCDPDVPSKPDDVNQQGRLVPSDLPRVDFYHWVLVDIPASTRSIAKGSHSDCVTARGKTGPNAPDGMRHGENNYTDWFAGDANMGGNYFGYDGPCPPWNDSIIHHYHFTLYALSVDSVPLEGSFGGAEVLKAIESHIIESASLIGTYSMNPSVA